MVKSMTAFARREESGDWGSLVWELRSLNHRYLELTVRMPEEFRGLESVIRGKVSKKLNRGKVECNLRYQAEHSGLAAAELNHSAVAHLVTLCAQVEAKLPDAAPIRATDLLSFPGVLKESKADVHQLGKMIVSKFDLALDELVETRQREGERIEVFLQQRCDAIRTSVLQVRERRPQLLAGVRERLLNRLEEIRSDLDPQRLEQEMVLLTQKLDVDEELDRLDAHVAELIDVLQRKEPVGRRLDFLLQELNREANTLGSKSADTATTAIAVDLKVVIEQMREQVQNIE